jgi:hypothetical protein
MLISWQYMRSFKLQCDFNSLYISKPRTRSARQRAQKIIMELEMKEKLFCFYMRWCFSGGKKIKWHHTQWWWWQNCMKRGFRHSRSFYMNFLRRASEPSRKVISAQMVMNSVYYFSSLWLATAIAIAINTFEASDTSSKQTSEENQYFFH